MNQAANNFTEGVIVPEEQAPVKDTHSTSAHMVSDDNEFDPEIGNRNVGDDTLKADAAPSGNIRTRVWRIAFIGILFWQSLPLWQQ
jgi:hypothetical protein